MGPHWSYASSTSGPAAGHPERTQPRVLETGTRVRVVDSEHRDTYTVAEYLRASARYQLVGPAGEVAYAAEWHVVPVRDPEASSG